MTPLEEIKQGILTDNMKLVASGYSRITNEVITAKPRKQINSRTVVRQPQQKVVDQEFVDAPSDNRQMTKVAKAEQFIPKRRINLWNDDKTETLPDYTEKDKEADIKAKSAPRVARPQAYTPVNVNCYSCGSMYSVNPAFIIGGSYRCDKCNSRH